MNCYVCKREFDEFQTNYECPNCGFTNFDLFEDELDVNDKKLIDNYRTSILQGFTSISIQADSFRLNSNRNGFDRLKPEEMFEKSLTGMELYKKTVWSKLWIANPKSLDIVGKEQTVPFSYKVNGQERPGEFKITPGDTEGVVCSLGMSIDENLRLHLYLGNEKVEKGHAEVDIKWRKDG